MIIKFKNFINEDIFTNNDYVSDKFEVGDKVKCVNCVHTPFKKTDIYEILFIYLYGGVEYLKIKNINDRIFDGWLSKRFELVEEPLDDRFEKWEEMITEEYDYDNNGFEIGDKVKFVTYKGSTRELYIKLGEIYTIKKIFKYHSHHVITLEEIKRLHGYDPKWFKLVEEPLNDRFEKWEE